MFARTLNPKPFIFSTYGPASRGCGVSVEVTELAWRKWMGLTLGGGFEA